MDKTIIISKTRRSIESRLEELASNLEDLDISHNMDELILKAPDEFLIIKEYRKNKLTKMQAQASAALRNTEGSTLYFPAKTAYPEKD